ncbi:possible TonB-dependent receptor [Porphyromonas gingivalis TDC60]|nr:porin [Porphyromonas gingivalis]BAK26121.1 possible TonB-dependent receptor [Porphyromonas gingivalis TDC60]
MRIENTHFKGNHAYTQVIDTTYINFFPSLGLNWAVNKNNKINFNYTRKISRPSFNNLSPNIRYDNVFFYRQGNPYLLPTITDDLSLSYSFKSIRLNAGYRHKKKCHYL